MTEWIALGLGAIALAAVVGWLKAYRDARDWEMVCQALGDEYDSLVEEMTETERDELPLMQPKRESKWLVN